MSPQLFQEQDAPTMTYCSRLWLVMKASSTILTQKQNDKSMELHHMVSPK
jgi:hypothetical protein